MSVVRNISPPRSAYLHIPFCYRRCFYCDFAIVPLGDKANHSNGPGSTSIKSYLELLHREIALTPSGPPLSTIYIGGGTPSLLSPCQIKSLLEHLKERFGIQSGAEVTMEMDPASFGFEELEAFLSLGINRVSLGVQSFNDEVLEKIGRTHRENHISQTCKWLHQAIENRKLKTWNLDLIQNLPEQNISCWEKELFKAINTHVPHLSIYDLSIEPGTVFSWKESRGELELPNEDLAAKIMDLTNSILCKAGFARYEISNYSKPGHASRHNRVYWSGAGWWGFGQGATSSPWGKRLARPRTRNGYQCWIETQETSGPDSSLSQSKAVPINLDDLVLTGLRRREGVDLEALGIHFGWSQTQCKEFLPLLERRWERAFKQGCLKRTGNRLKLSNPKGMRISNQVFLELILWWDSLPESAVSVSNP